MFTVQTKSMLAKLMATENIRVEHRNTKTACFNLKTRVLTCPSWKDMSGDLYDLLMGHEISHALRTPMEGWHNSVIYAGGNKKASPAEQKAFKHFLNVVEDARIEKLVKRQYPGLRRPMIQGYKELMARDFFGISAISDFNSLYLIDKLNLSAKCGTLVDVKFTPQERPFYDAMLEVETWEEVVALAKKLYNYSKAEQQQGEKKKQELADYLKDSYAEYEEGWGDEDDEDEDFGDDGEDVEGDSDSSEEEEEEEEKDGKKSKTEGEDAEDEEEEKADDRTVEKTSGKGDKKTEKPGTKKSDAKESEGAPNKGAAPSEVDENFIPSAKTDESFRDAEESLAETSNMESYYITLPTPKLADILVPAKIVNDGLTPAVNSQRAVAAEKFAEFKKRNEDYISLLAKEFEMKKAARSFAKAKISDSGDININKLANYRLEDNIFRKMIEVHKGKSHGLVLILDKSGSMSEHIEGAMEQILVMALFCRKVNIPFVAYSFTNCNSTTKSYDFKHRMDKNGSIDLHPFTQDENDLRMGDLDLREMLNSKMSAGDFSQAIMNHLMLANGLKERRDSIFTPPCHERMGGTPLNEALVVLRDVIRQFKMNHRLDIVNAIVVHDGDSDGNREFYNNVRGWNGCGRQSFYNEHNQITLIDKKEKLQIRVPKVSRGMTIAIMQWLQMTAHCGVFGFYITGSSVKSTRSGILSLYQSKLGIAITKAPYKMLTPDQTILADKLGQEVINNKYLESFTDGYTRLYFIPGDSGLKVEQATLEQTNKTWTPSRLLTAFKKVNKKKNVSRVLVSRFIELMAV